MILLGIIALILGYILNLGILVTIGWILFAIGAVLLVLGVLGNHIGGRRYWY